MYINILLLESLTTESDRTRPPACDTWAGTLAGLAAARLDSAAGLSRATHLCALAVDLADGAAPAEVREGGHIEVEGLLLALGVAHTREVAVDVEEVVPVGLVPRGSGDKLRAFRTTIN